MAKLVEILARELVEWPMACGGTYHTEAIAQDLDGGLVRLDHLKEPHPTQFNGEDWSRACWTGYAHYVELSEDHATAIVTRPEWQAAVDALKAKDIASSTAAMIDAGWIDPKPPVSPSLHAQVVGRANRIPEWDGVGLPPIGTRCEMSIGDSGNEWIEGTVVCHINWERPVAVAHNEEEVFNGYAEDFRPIRTTEQIAAEEREIDLIEDDISHVVGRDNRREAAEAIYKAGYRKQEPK